MKTIEKQIIGKFPKPKFTKVDSIPFLEGIELFAEKNARAAEYLKNIKLPPR
jgi:hypothetical protein